MTFANAAPRILVTGASDGIGRATALALAARGARVLAHGRSEARLDSLHRELSALGASEPPVPLRADLSRLAEVRGLAADLARLHEPLDAVLFNAGILQDQRDDSRHLTEDGFERTQAVNHLAPFLLAHLLLAARRPPARLVFVASDAHAHGAVDPGDPGGARAPFDRLGSYCASKLANVLTAAELGRRLRGRGISVLSLHPGVVSTRLLTEGFGGTGPDSAEEAAAAIAPLLLDAAWGGGRTGYFDKGRPTRPSRDAEDAALARRFYQASAAVVGVAPLPEPPA